MSNTDGPKDAVGTDEAVDQEEPDARESFDLRDELTEAFGTPRPTYAGGEYAAKPDDLPRQLDDGDAADAHAPPFLKSNQCCIADRSEFVWRDDRGRVTKTFQPAEVTRDPDGKYRTVVEGWSRRQLVSLPVIVEPKRIECVHLVRQLQPPTPSERASGYVQKGWVKRYCAARRSTAGAFLDLTDREMGACSLRDPFDAVTAQKLDDFDDSLEGRSANREYAPMFDLTKKFLEPMNKPETKEGV